MTVVNALTHFAGSQFFARLLEATLKSSMLLLLAFSAHLLLRSRSAALRHLIWMTGIAAAIGVLLLAPIVPSWRIWPTRLSWSSPAVTSAPIRESVASPPIASSLPRPANPSVPASTQEKNNGKRSAITLEKPKGVSTQAPAPTSQVEAPAVNYAKSWPLALLALWIIGALACCTYYLFGAFQLRRLQSRSVPIVDPAWNRNLQLVAARLSIRRPIALLSSDRTEDPLTFGIFRPKVVLPADACEWSRERIHVVINHELAHIARIDALSQLICHAASALYWFNPLVWFALRTIRLERERACDDYVLAAGTPPSKYANDLLVMVSNITKRDNYRIALAMARPSHFEGRLLALLNPRLERKRLSKASTCLIACVSVAFVLPLAALSPALAASAKAPVSQSNATSANAPAVPAYSPEAAQVRTAAATPALIASTQEVPEPPAPAAPTREKSTVAAMPPSDRQTGFECGNSVESQSQVSSHSDGQLHTWRASWDAGNCKVTLNSQAEISFNSDFSDIQRISSGGFVDIDTSINGETHHLGIRPSSNGALDYTWSINGSSRSFDQDGHAWLAKLLVALDRHSALGMKQRLPKLLQEGGPRRVLEEVSYMNSDYARAIYLLELLRTADLGSADLQMALTRTTEMSSDYECARVLMAVAEKYPINDPTTRSAFLTAINNLHSDYEHARVLMAFFGKGEIPVEMARSLLESASRLKSDYEHARVLVEMANRKLVDSSTQADFLKSVNNINSDYEHARTLVAFFEARKSDDAAVLGVIRSVPEIHSDYEASRVLTMVAGSRRIEGDLREEYVRVARNIHSDHERSQALNALGNRPTSL